MLFRSEHGKRLGRTLGFPTLNVAPNPNKLMPPNGVYAVQVKMDGKVYGGIALVFVIYALATNNPHAKEYLLGWIIAVAVIMVAFLII